MIVDEVEVLDVPDGWYLRAAVSGRKLPAGGYSLEYVVRGLPRPETVAVGDVLVPALLLPAMAVGEDLHLPVAVSGRLLDRLPEIIAIYRAWTLGVTEVRVVCDRTIRSSTSDHEALFFSGGVDSFYSLIRPDHRPVSHLVFVNGFDIPLENPASRRAIASVARVCDAVGAQPVTVTTNLRSLSEPLVGWGAYHGAALASVALLLSGRVGRCTIAAGMPYQHLTPWGSHPLLDPMWSTESVEVIHDGADATRLHKLAAVAQNPVAVRALRVCHRPMVGWDVFNCGRCDKCLITMAELRLLGQLDHVETLPPLDLAELSAVSSLRLDLMEGLEVPDADSAVVAAVKRARRRRRWRQRRKNLLARLSSPRGISLTPGPPRVARTAWDARPFPLTADRSNSYAPNNQFLRPPPALRPDGAPGT